MECVDKGKAYEGRYVGELQEWDGIHIRISKKLAEAPGKASQFLEELFEVLLAPPITTANSTSLLLKISGREVRILYSASPRGKKKLLVSI